MRELGELVHRRQAAALEHGPQPGREVVRLAQRELELQHREREARQVGARDALVCVAVPPRRVVVVAPLHLVDEAQVRVDGRPHGVRVRELEGCAVALAAHGRHEALRPDERLHLLRQAPLGLAHAGGRRVLGAQQARHVLGWDPKPLLDAGFARPRVAVRLPLDEHLLGLARAVPPQPERHGARELCEAPVVQLQGGRIQVDGVHELRVLGPALRAAAAAHQHGEVARERQLHGREVVAPHPVLRGGAHEGPLVDARPALWRRGAGRARRVEAAEAHDDVRVVVADPAHVVHARRVEGRAGPLRQHLVVLLQQLAHSRHVQVHVALHLQKRVAGRLQPRAHVRPRVDRLERPHLPPHGDDARVGERVHLSQLCVHALQEYLVAARPRLALGARRERHRRGVRGRRHGQAQGVLGDGRAQVERLQVVEERFEGLVVEVAARVEGRRRRRRRELLAEGHHGRLGLCEDGGRSLYRGPAREGTRKSAECARCPPPPARPEPAKRSAASIGPEMNSLSSGETCGGGQSF